MAVGATLVVAVAAVVVAVSPPQPDKLKHSAKTPMKARNDLKKWSL